MTENPADGEKPGFRSDVTVELVKHSAADSDVLWAARVSTAGEQSLDELTKDPARSKGLINYLMRDRHGSPFEHNSMTFFVSAPIFVFREFMRHRVGWCLAGDTRVTLDDGQGRTHHRAIADLYRAWHGAGPGAYPPGGPEDRRPRPPAGADRVRCHDERTLRPGSAPIVDVVASGVKPLLRLATAGGRALRCSADHAVLTPDGWRKAGELAVGDPVLVAGSAADLPPATGTAALDAGAAGAAGAADGPVGGGAGAAARPDPLVEVAADGEEPTYDLTVAGPWHNFLADGVVVHNSYNEESGRYRQLLPVFYVPGPTRKLVQQGRPGKYEFVEGAQDQHDLVSRTMEDAYRHAYEAYQEMLAAGIAREVARSVLPVGLFSSMYATCNARSLMHFLSLRTRHEQAAVPSFPQREIEMVAERMEALWSELMPLTHAAFNANGRVAP